MGMLAGMVCSLMRLDCSQALRHGNPASLTGLGTAES